MLLRHLYGLEVTALSDHGDHPIADVTILPATVSRLL